MAIFTESYCKYLLENPFSKWKENKKKKDEEYKKI